jgi:hypothetical protein
MPWNLSQRFHSTSWMLAQMFLPRHET